MVSHKFKAREFSIFLSSSVLFVAFEKLEGFLPELFQLVIFYPSLSDRERSGLLVRRQETSVWCQMYELDLCFIYTCIPNDICSNTVIGICRWVTLVSLFSFQDALICLWICSFRSFYLCLATQLVFVHRNALFLPIVTFCPRQFHFIFIQSGWLSRR